MIVILWFRSGKVKSFECSSLEAVHKSYQRSVNVDGYDDSDTNDYQLDEFIKIEIIP